LSSRRAIRAAPSRTAAASPGLAGTLER
jgi:hypothetical protein